MAPLYKLRPGLELVLASASPRRKELLASLGLPFTIMSSLAEPAPRPGAQPADFAREAALAKAQAIPSEAKERLILSADTVVSLDGVIFGKPHDTREALRMLLALNGRAHQVFTAFCLKFAGQCSCSVVGADVRFGNWPEEVLRTYAASGEPLDKAGAYAIQGQGAFLVQEISGSWTNVVGLPLAQLVESLTRSGYILPEGNP